MLQELAVAGITVSMYSVFDSLAGLTLLFYILIQTKKYQKLLPATTTNQRKLAVFAFLQLLIMSLIFYRSLLFLNHSFADRFTNGNGNYYGNLTAWLIVITLFPVIFKVSPIKTMDLLSPGLPLCLFVAKLACFFHGCCSGFEMSNSWYFNQRTERYEFPVQLLEALVALMLYIFLRRYQKRNKTSGSVFPVYLILYATSRFVTEFFRADLPNILGPFDTYQIMSIVYVFLGAILLSIVRVYQHQNSGSTQKSYSAR